MLLQNVQSGRDCQREVNEFYEDIKPVGSAPGWYRVQFKTELNQLPLTSAYLCL